jgi:hypothetical protein
MPLGIAILALLMASIGALYVVAGIMYYVMFPFISFEFPELVEFPEIGIIPLGTGLFGILIAWGLWKGKGWAWNIVVAVYLIGIVIAIISMAIGLWFNVINAFILALFLYYFFRPHVKAWFGKAQ